MRIRHLDARLDQLRPLFSVVCLFAAASCSKATATSTEGKPAESAAPTAAAAAPATAAAGGLTVGFIYVGPKDDYGYNQAHAEGAKAVAKIPGVKIREQEKVAETVDVQTTMASMINDDGA